MLYLSFKFVHKFKFCVSPLVKRYPDVCPQVSDQKKLIGSTEAMQSTVRTSQLMTERLRIVPDRVKQMENAILAKDMNLLAECTMKVCTM